ncbi:AfsR/SARP family transcriptional regulator [Dactylosporangium darangshiense]|uniref:AfsR/SARP family transcriptional regulator n=1 Tax=Dactylosporangium darangshiense TaxID=579108 RepID=UPI00362C04FF
MRLLGPIDVVVGDEPRPVQGLRRKAVLAVLGLHAGEVVSTGRLVELVWDGAPPPNAVNALQSHLSYLRRTLSDKSAVRSRPPGYVLDVGADGTDVAVAERLIAAGLQDRDDAARARDLQRALELWRGQPMADATGVTWLEEQAQRLEQLWLQGKRALLQARLGLGQHAQLLPELEQLTREHPFDEQLHGQLMLALYRTGRQADALGAFQRLRRTLRDDLGIEPGNALRGLESAMLRQDADLDPPPAPVRAAPEPEQRDAAEPPARCPRRSRSRCAPSPGGPGSWPASTRCCRPSGPRRAAPCSSPSCPARPASASPRSRCTGRTGSPTGSPTGSCTSTCAASTRPTGPCRLPTRCAGSSTRSACRPSASPATSPASPACCAAAWPASGC